MEIICELNIMRDEHTNSFIYVQTANLQLTRCESHFGLNFKKSLFYVCDKKVKASLEIPFVPQLQLVVRFRKSYSDIF